MAPSRTSPSSTLHTAARRSSAVVVAAAVAAGSACSDAEPEATRSESGASARISAYVVDQPADAPGPGHPDGAATLDEPGRDGDAAETGEAGGTKEPGGTNEAADGSALRGEMVANYIVSVYSEDGAWVDLGRRAELRTSLQDASGAALAAEMTDLPPGTYTRVRATLCHAEVRLEPGSRVAGRTLDEERSIHITETGDVVIERPVSPIRVAPDSDLHLSLDLRSSGWVTDEAVRRGEASIPRLEESARILLREPPAG